MEKRVEKTIENLRKNNMEANYFESSADAVEYLKKTMRKGAVITLGGSVSLTESGVRELISNGDYNFYDRGREGITEEELLECYKMAIGCDYFFCSSNAITENGELLNIDGIGNRIASIAFGPNKVYIVAGVNKIVKDKEEAFLRVKKIAGPKNCVRLDYDTPCKKLGKCVSLLKSENPDFFDGCDSPEKICRDYLFCTKQKIKDRISVLLINETLGY